MQDLWTEKYRPKSLSQYVFRDDSFRRTVEKWVKEGVLPHVMMVGGTGLGKTSLFYALMAELEVPKGDILRINASQENSVDTIRDKVINFASTIPFGECRYILLDEADYLTLNAQAILRGVMEMFQANARFCFTLNYGNKIIPELKGRCQELHFDSLDFESFVLRIVEVLEAEQVTFDPEVLMTYIKAGYPDLRKTLNLLQPNCSDGNLLAPSSSDTKVDADYKLQAIDLIQKGRITEARKLICSQIRLEEYEDMYRFLYRNLEFWGETQDQQNKAILAIRDGLVNHTLVADVEINLAAVLVSLELIRRGEG